MSLKNITPTTELEALNAVLSCLGEAPVESLESEQPDVQAALVALRAATREVQSANWRFNTQLGYTLSPSGTYEWDSTTLNIFTPPANLLRAEPSQYTENGTFAPVSAVLRQAERYTVGDPDPVKPMVFFDLDAGRDGFADRDTLRIDAVFAFDFVAMPEAARRYATVVASRRFAHSALGNPDRSGFIARDEAAAYRELVRSQRPVGRAQILTLREQLEATGGRPLRRTFGLG